MADGPSRPPAPAPSGSRSQRPKIKPKPVQALAGQSSVPALVAEPARAGPSKLPAADGAAPRRTVEAVRQSDKKRRKAERERARAFKPEGERWDAIPVAQSEASAIPPVWSADGRFYFTAANTSVFVHSATAPTFARLSTLSSTHPQGHKKPITALVLHPTNPLQLLTSSEDGTLKVWDWVEGRLIRTTVFADDGAVTRICPVDVGGKWWVFGSVTNPKPGKKPKDDGSHLQHRVMRVPLAPPATAPPQAAGTDAAPAKPVAYLYLVGKLRHPAAALSASPRGAYLVALAGRKAYVYRLPQAAAPGASLDDKWKPTCVKFVSDQPFTCGLFAPERRLGGAAQDEWFATGDERGVVRLWHGLGDAFAQLDALPPAAQVAAASNDGNERRLPTTSLHWHAHAVSGLAFSPSGAQLLSVGDESVLVQWHLASGRREYIPRLGGRPILSIAVRRAPRGAASTGAASEDEYWLGLADGAVVRVGAATGAVSSVGQGVRIDPLPPAPLAGADPSLAPPARPYPLAVHGPSRALVLPSSHPGTLQFVDVRGSAVAFELEVAPSNRVSRRDERAPVPVAVERVAFSDNARAAWMATVEGRPADDAEGGGRVSTLKLWRWDGARYVVNTQFPKAHGAHDVSSLGFAVAPEGDVRLVTTGGDTAKVWHVRQARKSEHGKTAAKRAANTEAYWSLRSTFSYRALPVHASACSPDGTLVALAHGRAVSLWDAGSNVLVRALEGAVDARHVAFAGAGRHLVAAGLGRGLAVWDLLSCEVVRTLPDLSVDHLVPLPSGFLAAARAPAHTAVTLFSDTLAQTVAHVAVPAAALVALPPASAVSAAPELVAVSPAGAVSRFGPGEAAGPAPAARAVRPAAADQPRASSVWQEMFGKDAFLDDLAAPADEAPAAALGAVQARARGRPAAVFDGPSHVMPPPTLLFDAFMDELVGLARADAGRAGHSDQAAPAAGPPTGIAYVDDGASVRPAADAARTADVRAVKDAELAELETFFRALMSDQTPATQPKPKTKLGLLNGHASNGTPRKPSTSKSVATPATPAATLAVSAAATPATPGETDDDVGSMAGSERKKTKKRKAPRE